LVVTTVAALAGATIGIGVDRAFGPRAPAPAAIATSGVRTDVHSMLGKVLAAVVSVKAEIGSVGGSGSGTGMILSRDGEVLTNYRVVAGAHRIAITRYGSTKAFVAHVVGASPSHDLALLRLDGATGLPTVSFGHSADVRVGDAVAAIGHALGPAAGTPSVTRGIISAEGRSIVVDDGGTTYHLFDLLQTDAAVNPGNSGGPLVDAVGRVIGINTAAAAGASDTDVAQNVGFAIPSDQVMAQLPALRAGGVAEQDSIPLGASAITVNAGLRQAYGLLPERGAILISVAPGSPAAAGGLATGDVVVAVNGVPVESADDLIASIAAHPANDVVRMSIVRGTAGLTLSVVLGSG
jgi:putative serine protease PepD